MERRVVITGMGIWSCIGTTLDEVRQSLFEGRSGIVFSQERKDAGFRSPICGNVPHPDLKKVLNRNVRQMMPEEAQYAYVATVQALEQAKLTQDYIDSHEVGVIYGNDSVAEATMIAMDKFRQAGSTAACGSGAIFQSMNSTVTMNLATLFHLKGINLTASAACASGSQSLGLGFLLIKNGLQDCIVCGGAEENNMYGIASFDALQTFSTRIDDPTKASRPFDRDRDGLVPIPQRQAVPSTAIATDWYPAVVLPHWSSRAMIMLCAVEPPSWQRFSAGDSQAMATTSLPPT